MRSELFRIQERAIAQCVIASESVGSGGDCGESTRVSGTGPETSAPATELGGDSAVGGSGRGDSISLFIEFDLRFRSESHRLEAEAQLSWADAEDAMWFVALAEEQLALIAEDRFHGISFRLRLKLISAPEQTPRAEDSERLNRNAGVKIALPKTQAIGGAVRDGNWKLSFVGLYMWADIALNELHEFGRTGGHHARQSLARLRGHSTRPKFLFRGRQAGTAAPAQQQPHRC